MSLGGVLQDKAAMDNKGSEKYEKLRKRCFFFFFGKE